jgi:hypothetical protein
MTFNVGDPGHVAEHNRLVDEGTTQNARLDALEADSGGGTGTVTSVNNVDPVSGNVTLALTDFSPAGVATNDSRLTNARTPTAHAATHASGGSDPVSPAGIGALTQTAADARYMMDTDGSRAKIVDAAPPIIIYDETAETWALRSTVSADATRPVWWWGPDAPPIGSGFAVDDLDAWLQTPALSS